MLVIFQVFEIIPKQVFQIKHLNYLEFLYNYLSFTFVTERDFLRFEI